jgi:hypothetical protein
MVLIATLSWVLYRLMRSSAPTATAPTGEVASPHAEQPAARSRGC